ncbi:MAG TPA: exo-beta-N-acetylmuramidase NamZ domain-containing protein, partial [Gemmatimonadaceae bacterium]
MTGTEMQHSIRRELVLMLALCVAALGACAMRGPASAPAPVRPGISVLLTDSIHLIRGKRVGLITNQTGVDEHGESDIERLRSAEARAAGVQLVRLFSPEHGIRGTEDREQLASGMDERSGLFIQSLYANGTIAPPDSTLRDLDVLVVDLQDIGTRTWTYVGAMLYAMKAAARRGIPIVVLDRPNPLSGL